MSCYNPGMLEFRILGPLEVLDEGDPVRLGGRNQRAVLALLLLRVNEPVSTERLVDELWGEHPPRTATTSLQNTVAQLRKLLGPGLLLTRPSGYVLDLDADQLDLSRFERLVREARSADPDQRAPLLRAALELWHGSPLADLESETFAQSEIRRLEELRLGVLEERIAADLALGADAELIAEIEALVRSNPLRERIRGRSARACSRPRGRRCRGPRARYLARHPVRARARGPWARLRLPSGRRAQWRRPAPRRAPPRSNTRSRAVAPSPLARGLAAVASPSLATAAAHRDDFLRHGCRARLRRSRRRIGRRRLRRFRPRSRQIPAHHSKRRFRRRRAAERVQRS